eukprot:7387866-Prymnesium_polylepis.2
MKESSIMPHRIWGVCADTYFRFALARAPELRRAARFHRTTVGRRHLRRRLDDNLPSDRALRRERFS